LPVPGILKTIYMGLNTCLDLTPQDLGIKSLCFYAMQAVGLYEKPKKRPNEVPVYHTSSYSHSNFTFPQYIQMVQDYGFWNDGAFEKNLLLPYLHCTENRFVYLFLFFFKQLLVALLADFIMILSGRQPVLMRLQRTLFNTLDVMKPFLFNNYKNRLAVNRIFFWAEKISPKVAPKG
ncbi:hypothetical protein DOY81_011719, partial [Sarcophaga bullata]